MRWKWSVFVALACLTVMGCKLVQSLGKTPQAPGTQEPAVQAPSATEPSLSRGDAFITSQELLVKESYPLQVSLHLTGSLPTPCHQLKVEVSEPDADNIIVVDAYSLVDPNEMCIQVLKAFDETIPLDSYGDGTYTVVLNGAEVGSFTQ